MLAFSRVQRAPPKAGDPHVEQALVENSQALAQALFVAANEKVQEAFDREKGVEQELRAVAAAVKRFEQQQQQWARAADKVNEALKEIGDVENWLNVIEQDFLHIESTVALVLQRQRSSK